MYEDDSCPRKHGQSTGYGKIEKNERKKSNYTSTNQIESSGSTPSIHPCPKVDQASNATEAAKSSCQHVHQSPSPYVNIFICIILIQIQSDLI